MDNEKEYLLLEEEMVGAIIMPTKEDHGPCIELYDSGAMQHISPYKADFSSYYTLSRPVYLNIANQQLFPAVSKGSLTVCMPNGATELKLTLHKVLHMPKVNYTLISLSILDEEGYQALIHKGRLEIISPHGEQLGTILHTLLWLYKVMHTFEFAHVAETLTAIELHCHLSYIVVASARKLVASRVIQGIHLDLDLPNSDCKVCIFVRTTCHPITKPHISPPTKSFDNKVHTDLWGPASIPTRKGRRYLITFMDNCTRFTVIFLQRTKDETLKSYKMFEAWVLTRQHCESVKVLRSDCGGKYLSKDFNAHLTTAGTVRRLMTHDMPQLNGVAECLNRMLLERVRALTHASGLPKSLWGEAMRHATWLKNQTAT